MEEHPDESVAPTNITKVRRKLSKEKKQLISDTPKPEKPVGYSSEKYLQITLACLLLLVVFYYQIPHYQSANGEETPLYSVRDGLSDCSDGSDEGQESIAIMNDHELESAEEKEYRKQFTALIRVAAGLAILSFRFLGRENGFTITGFVYWRNLAKFENKVNEIEEKFREENEVILDLEELQQANKQMESSIKHKEELISKARRKKRRMQSKIQTLQSEQEALAESITETSKSISHLFP